VRISASPQIIDRYLHARRLSGDRSKILRQMTQEAFDEADRQESKSLAEMETASVQERTGILYRRYYAEAKMCPAIIGVQV